MGGSISHNFPPPRENAHDYLVLQNRNIISSHTQLLNYIETYAYNNTSQDLSTITKLIKPKLG